VPLITPGSAQAALTPAPAGERALVDRIRARMPEPSPPLIVGIGDDGAVVKPERGALEVLTTDALVEGVHFDRRYSSLEDIGYRAMAVNVSDLAAMGAAPRLALWSLILPDWVTADDVDRLADGAGQMAREAGLVLAGGNLTRTPGPLVVDVTLIGSVRPRKFLTRGGGRAGDQVYVSGSVGAAAAGLSWLRARASVNAADPEDEALASCVRRYRRPAPRMRLGALLGRTKAARACMDLSDGLADAARQVAEASGTGVTIDAALLPIDPGAAAWFGGRGMDPLDASVGAGDDYELLFVIPPKGRRRLEGVRRLLHGLPLTRIGELTRAKDMVLIRDGRADRLPSGFSHF
jgi:thiamine-monophosphate kinase